MVVVHTPQVDISKFNCLIQLMCDGSFDVSQSETRKTIGITFPGEGKDVIRID